MPHDGDNVGVLDLTTFEFETVDFYEMVSSGDLFNLNGFGHVNGLPFLIKFRQRLINLFPITINEWGSTMI